MAIDGTWNISTKTPMGDQSATLVVTSAGTALTGTIDGPAGVLPIDDGDVDGDEVSWSIDIKVPFAMTVVFTGTVDGDTISGQAKAGTFGSSPFSGTRVG